VTCSRKMAAATSQTLLLEQLAHARLATAANTVREEGWKWVEISLDHPSGLDLTRIYPREVELSELDNARLEELEAELDAIGAEIENAEEPGENLRSKSETLEAEYRAIEARSRVYDPEAMACAGVFVFIDYHGALEVARGYVRAEDKPKEEASADTGDGETAADNPQDVSCHAADEEVEEGYPGLSERLVAELTAHRTMALRALLGANVEIALVAVTHAMAAKTFYAASSQSCLEISPHDFALEHVVSGIADTPAGGAVADRHTTWAAQLPERSDDLWRFVCDLDDEKRLALLAHCVALTVNTVERPNALRGTLSHGRALATSLALDMRDYWAPTASDYLERVSKAVILDAVREAVSDQAAENLSRLKKLDMAAMAEPLLLADKWLPQLLRSEGQSEHAAAICAAQLAQAVE
jgi:ParB family transcriptional regulator, chromosome partitioning protein